MSAIYDQPIDLLQTLIRFDTTNPPGNEIACIQYINGLLQEAGFETTVLAKDPNRPNLIARLSGSGKAPGLVLQGHVDVVTTAGQDWQQPPFAANIVDGYLWGRGSLDMKSGMVMMLCALLRAKAAGVTPAGDIILTVLSDEEAGSEYGANFLVDEHAEQFEGVRYAIGEGGGPPMWIGDQKYYSIMISEKQVCWMRATLRGPAGHASMPMRDGAMARLGQLLTTLNQSRLPVHKTEPVLQMLQALADTAPANIRTVVQQLMDAADPDPVLDELIAEGVRLGNRMDALLHNTVNATGLRASDKVNVIPAEVSIELDGRLLPGYTPDQMMAELHALLGDDVALEITKHNPGPASVDMGLFDTLAGILKDADPSGIALPSVASGFTDGRCFAKLGIQNYGFLPLALPRDFNAMSTVHAANERIPVDSLQFGVDALFELVQRYR
ncbi:MAG: M20/M25/M40 family metallo-hydrolase [Caldilineaceae bacterium]|nr:M20/M25/M40 family metallo-hydrolase [Caldilineaceae bacterium]